jgi:peroxiredoxin
MPTGRRTRRVGPGDLIDRRELETTSGETVSVPDPERLVHLQLRRFAGCPICSLHLRSIVQRHDAIAAATIREVVVFHSRADELRGHDAKLPFAVVADPDRQLYRELGVASSPRALLDPRVWRPALRGLSRTVRAIRRKEQSVPAAHPDGGRLGLPADFLIGSDGLVLACKYGVHAYDQWSPDELLALVPSGRVTAVTT